MNKHLDRKVNAMADPQQVVQKLSAYGTRQHEGERDRVCLAILKLSDGELDRLDELVAAAKRDYRDVLAWAEYPEEIKVGYVAASKLPPGQLAAIRRRDREQYVEWLED